MSTSTVNTSILKFQLAAFLAAGLVGCGGGGSYGGGGGSDGDGGGGGGPTYAIGGTVTGLNGTVVLRINGANDLTVSADGAFTFSNALAGGSAYNVIVQTQPAFPAQDCVVANGSGSASANVTNVTVVCSALANAELQADAGTRSATLSWTSPNGASSFNVYLSSQRNCDVRNFASCADGALLMNVTSPHTAGDLSNGQAYFFRIETVYANGARSLSNEAGARPNALAFNGDVRAIATAEDGTGYLGGSFTEVGITAGSAVPLDAVSGRFVVPDFPMVDGAVHAAAPDGEGGWYLGGLFTRVGDLPRRNLAHILANGSVDQNFNLEVDGAVDGTVRALAVSGSTLYAGGNFTQIDGVPRSHLAAISASGELLPWLTGTNSAVHALAVFGSAVYAGGEFTQITGMQGITVPRNHLAAFGAGGLPQLWDPDADGSVFALAISDGTVYAGGNFARVKNQDRSSLAAIGVDASSPLRPWNPSVNGPVFALAVSDDTVYAGGNFTQIEGANGTSLRNRLAAIQASDDDVVLPWDPSANGTVHALAVAGSAVYAGGEFTHIGGVRRSRLAAIDPDGALLPWNPSADDIVRTFAVSASTVYAGGDFAAIGGATRNHLAAIEANGTLQPWNPAVDGDVHALAISGSTVYAGGSFGHINGAIRNGVAAIDADGTLQFWNPGVDGPVFALAVSGSTVYAGGNFFHINGATRNRLAAIDVNGTLQSWDPGANNAVHALAISGSTVYVGGDFTSLTGALRNRLAAIGANGRVLEWNPDANGTVSALAISGSTVYAGGNFTEVRDVDLNRLAAIEATGNGELVHNGKLLPLWDPAANGPVHALAVLGSTVYVGGEFTLINGVARSGLAAIDANDTLQPWNPTLDNAALALAISGSTVHVGGNFRTLGGLFRSGLGAVSADGAGAVIP